MSDSDNAKRLFFEALAFMDASNFRDAELRLRDALKFSTGNVAILTNLAVVSLQQDKRIAARDYAETAIAIAPDNIEALLVLADCHTHGESFTDALAAYDKIIVLDPNIAQAHNNRGIAAQKLGRHAEALDSLERAIALEPGYGDAHINRGNALRHLKRYDDALAAYDRALALNADLPLAWLGRGNVFHDRKCHDQALAAYDRALALTSDLPQAWLGRGNVLCVLKRHDDALGAYAEALARNPDFAEAWLGRGNVLCELKRYDEASDAYGKALALKPGFVEAWYGRGNICYDRKRYGDALAAYDQALALDPEFTSAWVGRGDALRLLKHAPQSIIEAYREALKLGADAETMTFYLAALGEEPLPATSPGRFVASMFDSYADNFEQDLVVNLKYQMPVFLADAIKRYSSSTALDILDMGCGTGLMGEQIRRRARTLTGVDISANMLDKARQRQIYDQLICDDLVGFLQTQDQMFDLAIAADVFVYLGDLSLVFPAVQHALRPGGLFCFSVEATDEGDFVLRRTLRYAHSMGYLRTLAERYRFAVETMEPQVVRQDFGADLNGYLAVLRCS
ncbi:MAG: hypothetical protein QOC56_733 [Alphaproteobacteria bacterium]|jgi:predicted TPR repeat methyltransferase|nr:hypothetical protein [Alphaproteobacteria bacterium]